MARPQRWIYSWYYVGMGLLPSVAGFMRDLTGRPEAPIYTAAVMMTAALAFVGLFRHVGRPVVVGKCGPG